MSKFFDELMESIQQMDEIIRGKCDPSHQYFINKSQVLEAPKRSGNAKKIITKTAWNIPNDASKQTAFFDSATEHKPDHALADRLSITSCARSTHSKPN